MEAIIPFISAVGLGGAVGSAITIMLQAWLSRRAARDDRQYRERKEAYVGLLNAIHRSEVEGTPEAAMHVGHWMNVCDLVASGEVLNETRLLLETNPQSDGSAHPERPIVLSRLKQAMRKDLGTLPTRAGHL